MENDGCMSRYQTLYIDRKLIQFLSLPSYNRLEYCLYLTLKYDMCFNPNDELFCPTAWHVSEEGLVDYGIMIKVCKIPGLLINEHNTPQDLCILHPNFSGRIDVFIKNISDNVIRLSAGTMVGRLIIFPYYNVRNR